MKLTMAKNSLFAILLRKPWWISILIAVVLAFAASAMVPRTFAAYGVSAGFPFLVVGIIAAVRQFRTPRPALIAQTLEMVTAMSWRDFSEAIAAGFRRDGYEVKPLTDMAADFEIIKVGQSALVSCKRWKATNNGVEPLRELHAAAEARGAQEAIYITAGQLTENATRFADDKKIRVMQGIGLAQLLRA